MISRFYVAASPRPLVGIGWVRVDLLAKASVQARLATEVETNIGQERANDVQSVRTQAREEMEALRAEVRDLDTRAHTYREIADQFTARGDNIVRRADEELATEHKQRRAEAALFEIAKKRQDPERRPDITG